MLEHLLQPVQIETISNIVLVDFTEKSVVL